MLGIIFTGGESPDVQAVKRLLETGIPDTPAKPFFVAADSGLDAANAAGIEPDWVIGDMDSLKDTLLLAALPPECVIRHQQDKDHTDTELAFLFAAEKGCEKIWIIGGGGGRIDHLFAIRSMFERDIFPRRWITKDADIFCIDAKTINNEQLTLNLQNDGCCKLKKETVVSVFPLGGGPWEAKSTGLKWQLEGLPWDRGFFGLSNIAVNGKFSVKAEKGRFMVVLPALD
jgi:thiamine pyrophosphokinase